MKKAELNKLIESIVRKVLKETGEMSQKDLNPGGEFYEWAQSIKKSMQQLSRLTKGKVKFIEIKPYDKYLGPYASIAIDNKRDSVWSVGDTGNAFVIENLGIAGTVQLLASALLGNDKNYEQALKNAKQMSENKKVKKNLTEANSGSVSRDIDKIKQKLINTWKQKGGYENFGQKEYQALKSKYNYNPYGSSEERFIAKLIDAFEDWASSYDGN